ncbi:hypothetical protein NDU88_003077 [Pleurodeles waltl]|uniref:Uncharacterized protein n=1 Tax=Pleurodeles waltl TaxID=8319 RepID=A0AAV7LEA5_PLEWA|nr:hypothetical protein NDU88_003077 [Pleurodeles waltl]
MEQQPTRLAPDVALPWHGSTAQRQPLPSMALAGPSKGSTRPQTLGRDRVQQSVARHAPPTRCTQFLVISRGHTWHCVAQSASGRRVRPPLMLGGGASQLDTARVSAAVSGPLTGGSARLRRRPCPLGPRVCTGAPLSFSGSAPIRWGPECCG